MFGIGIGGPPARSMLEKLLWLQMLKSGGGIPIDPTRIYASIASDQTWTPQSDAYTVCVPVTTGQTYKIEFTKSSSGDVGSIFRYGFSDTDTPTGQKLSQCNRTTPQLTPSVILTADKTYLIIQLGASKAKDIFDNGYLAISLVNRSSPIVGTGQVGYMII